MPELKLYTIADLRNWIKHSQPVEGLSEKVIAPSRAWAIVNNPYVHDNDAVVSAIFDEGELAAFTATFPEMINGKKYWWYTTLWCNPKFQGKGYGVVVVGSLAEQHEEDGIMDRWGAEETIEIFKYLGLQTEYSTRYCLENGVIHKDSLKGKIAFLKQELVNRWRNRKQRVSQLGYSLRYLSYIDDSTYEFIKNHRNQNLFLHTQEMLNWELEYPYVQSCPILGKVNINNAFPSVSTQYRYFAVQVLDENQELIGFYVLRGESARLSVIYLYFDESNCQLVFMSILDHIRVLAPSSLQTEYKGLAEYVEKKYYFPHKRLEKISFSHPSEFLYDEKYTFQMGDGDSFA